MSAQDDHDFNEWVSRARAVLIEDVARQRGLQLRRVGQEFVGPCPHCGGDDRFSINTRKQIFNCRGCLNTGDVIEFVKFLEQCGFNMAVEILTAEARPSGRSNVHDILGEPVCWYDYEDENGVVRLRVVRYEPRGKTKTFRQWQPDGNGGWIKNSQGVRQLPYRLPQVLEAIANEQTILIVEGEKDVENLRKIGVPASCNMGGASKWRSDLNNYFRGADILLVPDNDDAGRGHIKTVAEQLGPVAARIRVLELPNLPAKGDVSDWLANGGTREQLDQLIEKAPLWKNAPNKPAFAATAYQYRDPEQIPRRAWIYRRHYVRGHVTTTVGPGGFGKTTLAIAEAIAMATGRNILGGDVLNRVRVWYWNGEDPIEEIERRIIAICQRHGIDPRELEGWLFVDSGQTMPIKFASLEHGSKVKFDEVNILAFQATIAANKIDVVVLDPFISCHSVSENDNVAIDQVVKRIGQIASVEHCGIEIPHHVRKPGYQQKQLTSDDARGGGAIVNACRSSRVLNRMTEAEAELGQVKPDERRSYFRIDKDKSNMAPPEVAMWNRLVDVEIPNGDHVAAVEPWTFPQAFSGISTDDLHWVRGEVRKKDYRLDPRSPEWVGLVVINRLGLDPTNKGHCARVAKIIKTWIGTGVLAIEEREDEKRRPRKFVVAGNWSENNDAQR